MMYNFIALGGIDDPESMFVEDIIQGIDESQVDAEAALATLKSLAAFLDYDENGAITEDDAIMMYNFIALGGIDDPESMFVEDIIQGIDETQVDAEKALENFKKYASK
jgi:FMN-dependent NADH-azoreductase